MSFSVELYVGVWQYISSFIEETRDVFYFIGIILFLEEIK